MHLPELQFIIGKLRGVDEFLHVDDSAAARAGTLGEAAAEHGPLSFYQLVPFGGLEAEKILQPVN